ncbi:type II toxin-antitoxin system VapC family toxin [Saxibacter everestensis]|uniref:Ribonuclease VapC n=1 Tax=Saxibacter everestensis TaxID=2909229 RepID=A0ABY8QNQ0_9MICO|nr:type II toxin-antitoxin system VapC family toxin [Brevibacteriaceae bacterium ZFBP1038]
MILVDTSIWVDHLHQRDPELSALLARNEVGAHNLVIGELALGSIRNRQNFLELMTNLPRLPEAGHAEVLAFVDNHRLYGRGLSLVDAHLLAAVQLSPGSSLWTRDKRLAAVAAQLEPGA